MTQTDWMFLFIMAVILAIFLNVWFEFTQKTRELLKIRKEYKEKKREDKFWNKLYNDKEPWP